MLNDILILFTVKTDICRFLAAKEPITQSCFAFCQDQVFVPARACRYICLFTPSEKVGKRCSNYVLSEGVFPICATAHVDG